MSTPAIFRMLEGKVPHEVMQAFTLLFNAHKDTSEAVKALKGQHAALSSQVTATTKTANTAAIQAAAANAAIASPVPAGQANVQIADYSLQQNDHLGVVSLQGTSALTVTLNNLVEPPFVTHIANQSTQPATLTPLSGTLTGSSTLAAGAAVHAYFDGYNWIVA